MTPEEKANELIEKFREYVKDLRVYEYEAIFSKKEETENATQCAIIAVEEIIALVNVNGIKSNDVKKVYDYYNEVINHLKNKS